CVEQECDDDTQADQRDRLPQRSALARGLFLLALLGRGHDVRPPSRRDRRSTPDRRRRSRTSGNAMANPPRNGAAPPSAVAVFRAGWAKVSGMGSVLARGKGQTITKARPTTLSAGMVPPPGSWVWDRESSETERWSPITHSRPSGTSASKNFCDGTSPGYR